MKLKRLMRLYIFRLSIVIVLLFSKFNYSQAQCIGNLLTNGSFTGTEGVNVTVSGWSIAASTPDVNDANGLINTSPTYFWTGTPLASPDGGTWQNLFSQEAVQQTVTVTPGQWYTLQFYYAAQGISCGNLTCVYTGAVGVKVFINNTLAYTTPDDVTQYSWEFACYSFLASTSTVTIKFLPTQTQYVAIDGACLLPMISNNSQVLGNDTVLCSGATLNLNATTANSTYLWQDNSTNPNFTVTQAGTYWVRVTNSCGVRSDTINVSYTSLPTVNIGNDTTICYNKTVFLNAYTAGLTYQWQDGSTTPAFLVLHSGTYWVKVKNQYNCISRDTIHIYNYPLIANNPVEDTILCNGQTCTLNATNANCTYLWQNGSTNPTLFVNQQGTYSVIIKDSYNCYTFDTTIVTYTPVPHVNLGNDTVLCYWQYIVLSAVNANCNYLWQDGSTFSNSLINTTGTYWAMAYVNSNCWARDTVTVTFKPSPNVNLGPDTIICNGQTLTLNTYFSGSSYLWQNGSTQSFYNITQPGTYWVRCTINAGCYYSDTISVSFITSPIANIGHDTTLCQGIPLTLNATTPNVNYLWQNGATTPTFNVTQGGVYWVKVTSGNNCFSYDTVVVTYTPLPHINLGNDTVMCPGITLVLNPSIANATYHWQDGTTTLTYNVNQQGTYWVQATVNNCSNKDTINVSYSPAVVINLGNDTTLCQGQTIVLNATTTNATYVWQDTTFNPIYTVSQQGVYWVKVINQYSCYKYDTINVNYSATPQINLGNDTTLCSGDALLLDATYTGANYLWQDNTTNATYNVSHQGLYWVKVINQNSCSYVDSITISYSNVYINLGPDITLCNGDATFLNTNHHYNTYLWQDNSIDSTYKVSEAGTYWVTVTDINNCKASDTIKVVVEDCLTPGIYIPNTFTPNGDGLNEVFKVVSTYTFTEFKLYIYNRWGGLIFESEDINNGWDGKVNLEQAPIGVYVYLLKVSIKEPNIQKMISGRVTLIR